MKKIFMYLGVMLILSGCQAKTAKEHILARINNYEIIASEFEEEFRNSIYAKNDTVESRKIFLDNLVNRKLILQDAQTRGLDKHKSFLKAIERFWEHSLLKLALDRKSKEIAGSVYVTDDSIRKAYEKMKASNLTDKSYEATHQQIKWEITRKEESAKMNDWLDNLRKDSQINIDYTQLEK